MRKFWMVAALVVCLCMLGGCCLSHQWVEPTCETPKLCEKCGETEGEALGHNWREATREACAAALREEAKTGDVLLFKGSRGMRMELILEAFLDRE